MPPYNFFLKREDRIVPTTPTSVRIVSTRIRKFIFCVDIYIYIYTHTHTYTYMYIYICTQDMSTHTHTHTHTHTRQRHRRDTSNCRAHTTETQTRHLQLQDQLQEVQGHAIVYTSLSRRMLMKLYRRRMLIYTTPSAHRDTDETPPIARPTAGGPRACYPNTAPTRHPHTAPVAHTVPPTASSCLCRTPPRVLAAGALRRHVGYSSMGDT